MTSLKQKITLKPFWSTSKPNFSSKHAKGDADILLIENNKVLLDNRNFNETIVFSMKLLFNNYFQTITQNFELIEWPDEPKFNIFDKIDIINNK